MQLQALEAIAAAMAGLLQTYPGAIPSAQAELAAIGLIDQQLADLSPEQLQAPIEVRRNAASLAVWSRDPLLGTGTGGSAFQVAMARG